MATPLLRVYRYCRGDGSLTLSVGVLILFVFVLYPMVEVGFAPRLWLDLMFALGLAFGAYFVFEPRPLIRVFILFLLATFVLRGSEQFIENRWLTVLGMVCALCACALFAILLLVRAMRDGRINVNRIIGAVGAYVLIGLSFSFAYRLLALAVDHAFAMGGTPVTYEQVQWMLPYFSFVTLTSTGYGDITPLHPYARSLATLESLLGGLFLTVLVARLVGLEMEWREEQRMWKAQAEAERKAAEDEAKAEPKTAGGETHG
jgi:hypothetical protein